MSASSYLIVDAGTSRTRVRLWHDGRVLDEAAAQVGAKDVAVAGHKGPLADALRDLLTAIRGRHPVDVRAVVCSGMITSNVGLVEVPHALAPIGLAALAHRIVRHDVLDVTDLPMYFVPGIKTVGQEAGWAGLGDHDVLRGEEVEIAGLLAELDVSPPLAFFHCGSHHKLIEIGPDAVVERSVTALTGELLAAIRERTILASSLAPLEDLPDDPEAVAAGSRMVRGFGFGRAVFLVRVGETIAGFERREVTAFLLGALAALDVQLIDAVLPPDREVVLYGGGAFPSLLQNVLTSESDRPVRVVDPDVSDRAAALGTVRLLELGPIASEIGGPT